MATPQLSPGVLVREVDLTVGRAENVVDNIGGIAGPFELGPVGEVVEIATEQELVKTFGKPISTSGQYEYWISAASYLSYGGILKVIRTDSTELKNSRVGYSSNAQIKIKNREDYDSITSGNYHYAAKTPGTWANGLKVCTIDNKADQILTFNTVFGSEIQVGFAVTQAYKNLEVVGLGTTSLKSGILKGIITGIDTSAKTIDVKVVSRQNAGESEVLIDYVENSEGYSGFASTAVGIRSESAFLKSLTAVSQKDWYDQQTLGLKNGVLFWRSIAPKPVTSQYALGRSSKNDAFHIVIVDDFGSISGIQGNILEKHIGISKATDAISGVNSPEKTYYRDYLANVSNYIYAGTPYYTSKDTTNNIVPVATGFTTITGYTGNSLSDSGWNQAAQGITFSAIGAQTFELADGVDSYEASLDGLSTAYDLLKNEDEVEVDYLIAGPSLDTKAKTQALANQLISIAESRKDCLAVISPYRGDVVNITNTTTQTNNVLDFFSPLSSSSYAIFDSGYKYTFDKYNNVFRYVPCSADVAGLMARTSLTSYPWFSPAGQQRGVLNNAIKLAYTPTKSQRDLLYKSRVNSVINQPGVGILLFGDKTALSYPSAFDRINVRRLFLTVEQALKSAAEAQLFELNNQTTRANFTNIVEPYLRDVQSKQGVFDFLVICDETNNTPDVIDNNEFRADIFLKPTRSINYITLTFVATRTGISFEEVAGRV
jgi:phage tail sheath protein FI